MFGRLMVLLLISLPLLLFAQRRSETRDLSLIKGAFEEAFVIVKQEYGMVSTSGKRFTIQGSVPHYSAGLLVDSILYIQGSALHPWETDTSYIQLMKRDTLSPYIKRTSIRSLAGQQFEALSTATWDTSISGIAKVYLSMPGQSIERAPLDGSLSGMVVTLVQEAPLSVNEAAPVRVQVQAASSLRDSAQGTWSVTGLLPGLQKNLGGAFFEAKVGPGIVRFALNALVESKVLSYRLFPLLPSDDLESPGEEVPVDGPLEIPADTTTTPQVDSPELMPDEDPFGKGKADLPVEEETGTNEPRKKKKRKE